MEQELTLTEAAEILGISRQRLAIIAQDGKIGHQVAGRYWVFSRAEVEAFKPNIQGRAGRPKSDLNPTMKYETPSSVPALG